MLICHIVLAYTVILVPSYGQTTKYDNDKLASDALHRMYYYLNYEQILKSSNDQCQWIQRNK